MPPPPRSARASLGAIRPNRSPFHVCLDLQADCLRGFRLVGNRVVDLAATRGGQGEAGERRKRPQGDERSRRGILFRVVVLGWAGWPEPRNLGAPAHALREDRDGSGGGSGGGPGAWVSADPYPAKNASPASTRPCVHPGSSTSSRSVLTHSHRSSRRAIRHSPRRRSKRSIYRIPITMSATS